MSQFTVKNVDHKHEMNDENKDMLFAIFSKRIYLVFFFQSLTSKLRFLIIIHTDFRNQYHASNSYPMHNVDGYKTDYEKAVTASMSMILYLVTRKTVGDLSKRPAE